MPVKRALSTMAPIFKGKGGIRNCNCYRTVRLDEHGMKLVGRVLEKNLCRMSVDERQFGSMSERGTVDAV